MLSGRVNSHDKVDALDAGAEDYVTKSFNIDELLARIRAVARRKTSPEPPSPVRMGSHLIDLANRTVRRYDDPSHTVHLTRTEWQLIDLFVRNPGKLISQRQLLQEVWGPTYVDQTQYLRQYLNQLRRKLEDDPARPQHLINRLTRTSISAELAAEPNGLSALTGIHDLRVDGTRVRFKADTDHLDAVLRQLTSVGVRSLVSQPPTLEELFLRHYQNDLRPYQNDLRPYQNDLVAAGNHGRTAVSP